MTPYFVTPDLVDDAWPSVKGLIASAVERGGDYTAEDIRKGCLENRYQIWLVAGPSDVIAAVVVTAILEMPLRKVCQIKIATGLEREEWQSMIVEIERWAKDNGCSAMKPIARKGWQRVLEPMGYRMTHVVLEKDL